MAKLKFTRTSDIEDVAFEDGQFIVTSSGEAYVDYDSNRKKITDVEIANVRQELINLINEKEPVVLFSGSSNAGVTLTDSASKYKKITIFYNYSGNTYGYGSQEIYEPNGKTVTLHHMADNGTYAYMVMENISISDNKLTKTSNVRWRLGTSGNPTRTNASSLTIYKVIGYK